MKAIKTGLYLAGALGTATATLAFFPSQAFADWDPDDMLSGGSGGTKTQVITADSFSAWVKSATTWALAIAIVFFVFRVVITAIDRMLWGSSGNKGGDARGGGGYGGGGGGGGSKESPLQKLPHWMGPYTDPTWVDIFKRFGIQVGVCAGVWVIVNLVLSLVLSFFSGIPTS